VFAHSPEAKGRVERANGTFQDRLVSELRLAGASTLGEANDVLLEFLPRFNQRFGVPPAQAGSAYRAPDAGLDIDGVLCHKERRKVARDNTIQYHGCTLQLFPHVDRTSYAGARVDVQERLDGRLLVAYRGTVLTPQEAPPLAATLRTHKGIPPAPAPSEPTPIRNGHNGALTAPVKPHLIWYEDSELKRRHSELTKAGQKRARKLGKRLGRPAVTEREGFAQQFVEVVRRMGTEGLTLRQAARALDISRPTLEKLLDAGGPPDVKGKHRQEPIVPSTNGTVGLVQIGVRAP